MKKIIIMAIGAAMFAASGYGAKNPVNEKNAISITATKSVQKKTVALYKTKDESNVVYRCYYKLTLKKNTAYTVWLTGHNTASEDIHIRTAYGEESTDWNINQPLAYFDNVDCGYETRWVVSGKEWSNDWNDDWDGDDWAGAVTSVDDGWDWGKSTTPSTWTYYVMIEGQKGATAQLNYVIGSKIPKGVASNPLVIKPSTKVQTVALSGGFVGDYYYVKATLKGGKCYRFGTVNGKKANILTIDREYNLNLGELGGYSAWSSAYNDAISYVPDGDQLVLMRIASSKGFGATGKLRFVIEKQKAVAKHKSTALALNKAVSFKPGYLNKPGSGYFDAIVDEKLFKLSAKKGKNYVVETSGAKAEVPIVAYLYDSKGVTLQQNRSKGCGSADVRLVFTPAKSGTYYVGVCEDHGMFDEFKPKYEKVSVTATTVASTVKTVKISPVPGVKGVHPRTADKEGSSAITLGKNCWTARCVFGGTAGVTYALATSIADSGAVETNNLLATVYSGKISTKTVVAQFIAKPRRSFSFTAPEDGMYYVSFRHVDGDGLDYKPFKVHSVGYFADGSKCGALKVTLTGASGKWMLSKKGVKYNSMASVILPAGTKTLYFTTVKGYTAPSSQKVKVVAGKTVEVGDLYYKDKWDPKDDSTKKATAWTVKPSYTKQTKHTLWKTDKNDCFSIYSKKGFHYTFDIYGNGKGDQVFSIKDSTGKKYYAKNVTSVKRVLLPKSSKPYYLVVSHASTTNIGGAYSIKGRYENLGLVKFVKSAYKAKDSATSVTLNAVRTGNTDACRVKYTLKAGTAKAGVNYIVSTGYVGWKSGDKSKKSIKIKLVPKTLPVKSKDLSFQVILKDASTVKADDGLKNVRQAAFAGGKTSVSATVKIVNTAKYKNAAAAYASVYTDKKAKLKKDEAARLRTGTFYGIVSEDNAVLTNGAPEFAAVTLTVSAGASASKDELSAKVAVADRVISFKGGAGWDASSAAGYVKTLVSVSTDENGVCTNTLKVTVADDKPANWLKTAACAAELSLCVPDAAGVQRGVSYAGKLYRRNAKIQKYLDTAFLFDGYYTVSIVPADVIGTNRGKADDGVPEGDGYLTIAVDNKGGAKIAGVLPDGTPVTASATACAVVADKTSKSGYAMIVPVFQASATGCFAAEIRLIMLADKKHLDGKGYKIVVDSKKLAYWNNDDADTEDGVQGWRMGCTPVGGWYDKLANLQGYYNASAKAFAAGSPDAFPVELLSAGYAYVSYPSAVPVSLTGNKFAAAARSLVQDPDKPALHDFVASVNPCNVKITLNRATGVSSGTSAVWISNGEEDKQITGFKHFGVLTIDRDTRSGVKGLEEDVLIGGAIVKPITVGGRVWMFSIPFEVYGD